MIGYLHVMTMGLWLAALLNIEPLASAPWWVLSLPSLFVIGLAVIAWMVMAGGVLSFFKYLKGKNKR